MDDCILYQPGLGHQSVGQFSAASSLSWSSADLHIFPLTPPPEALRGSGASDITISKQ